MHLQGAIYLNRVGLEPSQVATCRKALFEQLFQVGVRLAAEHLETTPQTLRSAKAKVKQLIGQIARDEARFHLACEAVFRKRLPVKEADSIRGQLDAHRQLLELESRTYTRLRSNERASIVSGRVSCVWQPPLPGRL